MVSYKVISGSKVIGLESLNPYCSGRWSRTDDDLSPEIFTVLQVLILIVVEDGLVPLDNYGGAKRFTKS